MRYHLTTVRMPLSETPQITNVDGGVGKGNPWALCLGTFMAAATEESPAKVSCKTKNSTTVWLSGAAPGIYLKITKTLIWKDARTPVFGLLLWLSWVRNPLVMWETWVGKIPWRRERLPAPGFRPGECHALCSPWGRRAGHDWATLTVTSPVLTAALFTVARVWKQPSVHQQRLAKEDGILLSYKKWKFSICNNMDGFGSIMLSKIRQIEKDKYCMWNLKNITN